MAQMSVGNDNLVEFLTTGKAATVAEVKPEEAKPVTEPEKTEKVEAKEPEKAEEGADDDKDLPEKIRKIIGKKHRAMKESDEFAQEQFRAARAANKRADEFEARIKELESNKAPPQQADKEPAREDFKTDAEYWDAKIDWKAQQAVKADREQRAQEDAQKAAQAADAEFRTRLKQSAKDIPDFESVVSELADRPDEPTVAPYISDYIKECDSPAPLLYYFAQNPDYLTHLNTLSPRKALVSLGKLEVSLKKPGKVESTQTPPKVEVKPPEKTRAPEPIAPISGGSAPTHKELKDMNTRETVEYWQARERSTQSRRQRH